MNMMMPANAQHHSRAQLCSRDRRNILLREIEFGEGTLKTRCIFRVPLMWSRRFAQVVTQGRRRCALQGPGEDSFTPIAKASMSGEMSSRIRLARTKSEIRLTTALKP